jgi:hypothetical protein
LKIIKTIKLVFSLTKIWNEKKSFWNEKKSFWNEKKSFQIFVKVDLCLTKKNQKLKIFKNDKKSFRLIFVVNLFLE